WSRPPHHHVRLLVSGREVLVTQIYHPGKAGEPGISTREVATRQAAQTLRLTSGDRLVPLGNFDFILAPEAERP
ncbi:MAG: hypothetical protein KDG55_17270, partial [Rhodocyclaceae bacterium]|nr:hypothetical protein [Rhodocyclaceae bacterium]